MRVDVFRDQTRWDQYVYYFYKGNEQVKFQWEIGSNCLFKVSPFMKGKRTPFACVETTLSNTIRSDQAWRNSTPDLTTLRRVTFKPGDIDYFFFVDNGDMVSVLQKVFFTPSGLYADEVQHVIR